MGVNLDDRLLNEMREEILNNPDPHDEHGAQRDRDNEDATRGQIIRNSIANAIWKNYTLNLT